MAGLRHWSTAPPCWPHWLLSGSAGSPPPSQSQTCPPAQTDFSCWARAKCWLHDAGKAGKYIGLRRAILLAPGLAHVGHFQVLCVSAPSICTDALGLLKGPPVIAVEGRAGLEHVRKAALLCGCYQAATAGNCTLRYCLVRLH